MNAEHDFRAFCHNILWLRKHHNLSQKEMAGLLHISLYALRRLEHGIVPKNVDISILYYINQNFDIYPSAMFSPIDILSDPEET